MFGCGGMGGDFSYKFASSCTVPIEKNEKK